VARPITLAAQHVGLEDTVTQRSTVHAALQLHLTEECSAHQTTDAGLLSIIHNLHIHDELISLPLTFQNGPHAEMQDIIRRM
jgi:hypothetical protein